MAFAVGRLAFLRGATVKLHAKPTVKRDGGGSRPWMTRLVFERHTPIDITYVTFQSELWARAWSLAWRATELDRFEADLFVQAVMYDNRREIARMAGWDS